MISAPSSCLCLALPYRVAVPIVVGSARLDKRETSWCDDSSESRGADCGHRARHPGGGSSRLLSALGQIGSIASSGPTGQRRRLGDRKARPVAARGRRRGGGQHQVERAPCGARRSCGRHRRPAARPGPARGGAADRLPGHGPLDRPESRHIGHHPERGERGGRSRSTLVRSRRSPPTTGSFPSPWCATTSWRCPRPCRTSAHRRSMTSGSTAPGSRWRSSTRGSITPTPPSVDRDGRRL